MESAEAIAQVMADIRDGKALCLPKPPKAYDLAVDMMTTFPPVVVDVTAIYHDIMATDQDIRPYDYLLAPPWGSFALGYVNAHGNTMVLHSWTLDRRSLEPDDTHLAGWEQWETAEPIDWDDVRWCIHTYLWLGGRSNTHARVMPTSGPAMLWSTAVAADGTALDLHWSQLLGPDDDTFTGPDKAPYLTLLRSLDFLNCRNVEIVEPVRPRAERRRLERTGVPKIHTINVFPAGKSYRSPKGVPVGGVPLTSVRGHFAHYGACCSTHEPRGLLFGKLTGKVFVPQHVRGAAEVGESKADYRLVTES